MKNWIKRLFEKKPSNPYGVDEKKLRDMVRYDLPIEMIKSEFPSLPTNVLVKYIITGQL